MQPIEDKKKTIVMKFGGASLATPQSFALLADKVIARMFGYSRVAVVVSAMGDTTNQLEALARQVNPNPPQREYDMLVTVGERVSIALLAMALAAKGVEAISFTGSQSGIITCQRHSDARIVDVKPHRLLPHVEAGRVVIVAGFQGVSRAGEITTLGRGGSDTTAVALGIALGAEKVEFYKDVPGLLTADPKQDATARFLSVVTYDEALQVILKSQKHLLHPRCLQLAKKNGLQLHIRSFKEYEGELSAGTLVGTAGESSGVPLYEEE